jgi:hypothetical protein
MAMVLRCMGAIIVGMIVALVFVVAVELFSAVVHPVPPGFKGTTEQMCLHVERYPTWVLALVVPAWAGAAFAGTWISGRIGNRMCAICVGLLLIAAVVFNVSKLPYPNWFKIANLLVVPAAIFLGSRLSIRQRPIGSNEL